jgi:Acyl-CoA synthetases (AMP-forming)/AMP-acid ligases II
MSIFGRQISFDSFITEVEHLSHYLMSIGVKKGDSVCVCLPNIPQAIVAIYAINRIGAVINIVHPLLHSKGLVEILERTGSRVLFILNAFYYKYALGISKLKLDKVIICSMTNYMPKSIRRAYMMKMRKYIRMGWVMRKLYSNDVNYSAAKTDKYFEFPKISGDDTALYMHSGGTTGEPKTIMLSNRAINALANNIYDTVSAGEEGYAYSYKDAMLCALPLFHGYGLGVCVHFSACCRTKIVLVPQFNPKQMGALFKRENVTAMAAVPRMYQKLLNNKRFSGDYIKDLKNAYCGGDKMEQDLKVKFDEHMRANGVDCVLEEGYGLTETVNVCIMNTHQDHRVGSIGKPLHNISAKIVDANGNALPNNTNGELCISSDTLMQGYLGDAETTSRVLVSDESGKVWLKTGDLARIDDDGFVYFVDRLKRLIKISGMNVFPAEIERVVEKLDFVEQACAVRAKQTLKTIIVLNVVLKKGITLTPELQKQIFAHCEENLSKWAQPTLIIARESFPVTAIGKVDFKALEGKTE